MDNKFNNKYRIPSARKPGWDYSKPGLYFVTICAHMHECYFGEIQNGDLILSDVGKIAEKFWLEIPQHFPYVKLHDHQIMPNHMHGIIEILPHVETSGSVKTTGSVETPKLGVSTKLDVSTNKPNTTTAHATQKWKPGTLGVIINQYKRAVTINARQLSPLFAWQSRFHDRIIRNNDEYHRIAHYIKNNVARWNDKHQK